MSADKKPSEQPRLPLVDVPADVREKIVSLGGNPELNLYKTLASHPSLLSAWVDFAYSIRRDCTTSRQLRELMILRGAQLCQCEYERFQHEQMAKQCGLSSEKVAALDRWNDSPLFTEDERLALTLMENVIEHGGKLSDELDQQLKQHFTNAEYVELVLTAGFYAMVPRVLTALQIPVEK